METLTREEVESALGVPGAEYVDDDDLISDFAIQLSVARCDGDVQQVVEQAAYDSGSFYAKLYYDGWAYGITHDDLSECVGTAWCRWGDKQLDRETWRALFDLAGYREDDEPADLPTEPVVLWRGALPEYRRNWSWTDRRDAAHHFASGWVVQKEIGLIWRAVVEPERLLAKITGGCTEYVVETTGLHIEPDGLWCRCPIDPDAFRGSDRSNRVALDIHELVLCPRQ